MLINRELLEKQFTGKDVKQRKGNFGSMIDYVDVQLIIQRLNDAFDAFWSFKLIEYQTMENEVITLGELSVNGITKQQFGTSSITKNAKTGMVISIGDDLKAAASDSLKKCASLLGVALHIYGDSLPDQPVDKKTETINTANGLVELPVDEEEKPKAPPVQNRKKIPPPMSFEVKDTLPPPPVDKPRLQRMSESYFASLPEFLKDDVSRHEWQKKNIGIESTKDWTEWHFEKGLDMIQIINREHDPDTKKQVPELDSSTYENNGGSNPASPAQLKYIQKLLEKKNYYLKGDIEKWTIGKASVLINFLTEQ